MYMCCTHDLVRVLMETRRASLPLELELRTVVSYLVRVVETERGVIRKSSKYSYPLSLIPSPCNQPGGSGDMGDLGRHSGNIKQSTGQSCGMSF